MTIQNISALPDAPTPTDAPTDFATKAAAFVPAMTTFGEELNQFGIDVVEEVTTQVEAAQDTVNITAQGLFDAIVVGDTDGVNKEFDILNASFYPYWMLFQDGVKIPLDEITVNGTTATLVTAPTSGAKMEAIAPRSIDFIAPDGFKTIAFCSDKNGTIELECSVSGSVLPRWKIGGVTTESESFSYANPGEYVYIYLYVPDSSGAIIDAEAQDIYLIDIQNSMDSVSYLKMRDNSDLSYFNSVQNLTSLNTLNFSFYNCGIDSFPVIDSSNVSYLASAWRSNNLSSFGVIDTSSAISLQDCWRDNSLTSFPVIDTSNVICLQSSWQDNLLESFPVLPVDNVVNFYRAWRNNSLTNWPTNYFDTASESANYNEAWDNNDLSESAVDNILVSINNSNASNVIIGISGGTNATPSAVGLSAKADLESRGCTVNVN